MSDDDRITREDVDAAAGRIGRKLDIGVVTGVVATLISLFALFIGYREAYLAQQSLRADTLPIIDVEVGYNSPDGPDDRIAFAVELTNVGTGTAHVVSVAPTVGGEAPANLSAFLDSSSYPGYRGFSRMTREGAVGYLLAGDSVTPLRLSWGNDQRSRSQRDQFLRENPGAVESIDVEVCYCSVFDSCFIARASDNTAPREVKRCNAGNVETDGIAALQYEASD